MATAKIETLLNGISWDNSVSYGNITYVPIVGKMPGSIKDLDLQLADEDVQGMQISELEVEDVNHVNIESEYDGNLLVLSGLVLQGGRQTRSTRRPFLIKKGTKRTIPVNCIERGRWAYTDDKIIDHDNVKNFAFTSKMMSRKVRSTLYQSGYSQSSTWNSISQYQSENAIDADLASTESFEDIEIEIKKKSGQKISKIKDILAPAFMQKEQRGIFVLEDGKPHSLEVFTDVNLWKKIYLQILDSDALQLLNTKENGKNVLQPINLAKIQTKEAEGLADEKSYAVKVGEMVGWAIGLADEFIHLSVFVENKEAQDNQMQMQMQNQEFTESAVQEILFDE
ncbi:MAG: hypothetical protein IH840_01290 [Candidatus Heimdallarchaeota archaeon]|nr:hypothetical protein [Candidatus Heimdallarchaeota archaeon]